MSIVSDYRAELLEVKALSLSPLQTLTFQLALSIRQIELSTGKALKDMSVKEIAKDVLGIEEAA